MNMRQVFVFSIDPGSTKEIQLSDFKSPQSTPGHSNLNPHKSKCCSTVSIIVPP